MRRSSIAPVALGSDFVTTSDQGECVRSQELLQRFAPVPSPTSGSATPCGGLETSASERVDPLTARLGVTLE